MLENILSWCDSMIDKYQIADADVAQLQDLLNTVDESDIYGEAEYKEDEDIAEEE